jgi:hypothetical protein
MNEKKRKQGYRSILIGEAGELLVCQLFVSWGWLPRRMSLDQGIDHIVEVADEGRGQGAHFIVQTKATNGDPKISDAGISVPLTKKNIEYLQRQKMPVVLMFATNQDETIYWADARRAIKQASRKRDGAAIVHIPKTNAFTRSKVQVQIESDRALFIRSVIPDAHLPPAFSVGDAIKNEERRLSEIDPDISVKITAQSDSQRVEINPTHESGVIEFKATISFSSTDEKEKMRETIEFGVENEISVKSLELSGSPLFKELLPNPRAGMLVVGGLPQEPIRISARADGARGAALRFSGRLTRGQVGANAVVQSESHPVRANFRSNAISGTVDLSIGLDIRQWRDLNLLSLDLLDRAAEWAKSVSQAERLACDVRVEDRTYAMLVALSPGDQLAFENVAGALRELDDLREIALRYRSEYRLGDFSNIRPGEPSVWAVVRDMLDGSIVDMPYGVISFQVEDAETEKTFDGNGQMVLHGCTFGCSAFGERLCEIPVDVFFENCVVATTNLDSGKKISIKPVRGSISRMRRASTASIDLLRTTRPSLRSL